MEFSIKALLSLRFGDGKSSVQLRFSTYYLLTTTHLFAYLLMSLILHIRVKSYIHIQSNFYPLPLL